MTKLYPTIKFIFAFLPLIALIGCSTNQATGRSQFTGFMPASSEAQIGAGEHKKILAQYGGAVKNKVLRDYVTRVGQKIVPHTERKDVKYTFTLLDSPVVNAFALPGGYVYITRGILMLANNEAELAAVMAHEIGHVTARHSAERYSASLLTSIGASIASAAIKVNGIGQALGMGANLYLSSYSRSQEHEADDLGIRYIARAGYEKIAMANFLTSLEASAILDAKKEGKKEKQSVPNYFSTHPVTAQRIAKSTEAVSKHPKNSNIKNRNAYLRMINKMDVGDSREQGFIDNQRFVHTKLGFVFEIPKNYKTKNGQKAFIAQSKVNSGLGFIFSSGKKDALQTVESYITKKILKGDLSRARDFGTNHINNMNTASFETTSSIKNVKSNIRVISFEWDPTTVYVFTLAMPIGTSASNVQQIKKAAFSFKKLKSHEKMKFRPKSIKIRVAKSGDTVAKFANRFPYPDNLNKDRFRVMNGMSPQDNLHKGQMYKTITQ